MNNCRACGKFIPENNKGKRTEPHHIISQEAGGFDDEYNKLDLCFECHTTIYRIGWKTFILKFPHLKYQIIAAEGKKTE